jgi:hypothetical protein
MSLPMAPNTTCDIYRNANAPPAAPDAAGVNCYLKPDWRGGQEGGDRAETAVGDFVWTHILLVDVSIDIRDGYTGAMTPGNPDRVWVPDQNGTVFTVVFVERVHRGLPGDHKRVYLDRGAPSWPSDDL